MESYLKTAPPANASLEDVQRWADNELAKLEKVIQTLITEIEDLKNGP